MHKVKYFVIFLVVISITSCNKNPFKNTSTLNTRVHFNLHSLLGDSASARTYQQQSESVIQTIRLNITNQDGNIQSLDQPLSQVNPVVTFNIKVKSGNNQFRAAVLSNNGTIVCAGEQQLNVNKNGFNINIPLKFTSPIMEISTRRLNFNPLTQIDTLIIYNRGIETLNWEIGETQPTNIESPISSTPSRGTLMARESQRLIIERKSQVTEITRVTLPIVSSEGELSILVNFLKSDLIIESLTASGPVSVGEQNQAEVPLRVVVKNQGQAPANIFMVGIKYGPEKMPVCFKNPQNDPCYKSTGRTLPAGQRITIEGTALFTASGGGEGGGGGGGGERAITQFANTATFHASADISSQVDEFDEMNNESAPLELILP